jgi:hypothetical protein
MGAFQKNIPSPLPVRQAGNTILRQHGDLIPSPRGEGIRSYRNLMTWLGEG